jgi:hypothetical protein
MRYIPEEGRLIVKGRSLPEDAYMLFSPLIDWAKSQREIQAERSLVVDIEMDYFNSSSGRYLLEFLDTLAHNVHTNTRVLIRWFVEKDDELMMEKGEEFRLLVKIPFEFVYLD